MNLPYDFGCVYMFKSSTEEILYIGKTYSLRNRVRQHISDSDEWKKEILYIEYMEIENEVDRELIETYCINLHKPPYNIDKVYGNIKPTINIELPKLEKVLKEDIVKNIQKRNCIGDFKSCCFEYNKAICVDNKKLMIEIELIYPLIKEAFIELGFEKMKALEFIQKDIIKQLQVNSKCKSEEAKIVSMLGYKVGYLLDRQEVKSKIQEIYDLLKIDKKAKATDLNQWFSIKLHPKKINGEVITKIKILTCNIKT